MVNRQGDDGRSGVNKGEARRVFDTSVAIRSQRIGDWLDKGRSLRAKFLATTRRIANGAWMHGASAGAPRLQKTKVGE
jgi:hypothetical protein